MVYFNILRIQGLFSLDILKSNQLVFNPHEFLVFHQQWIIQNSRLHPNNHVLLLNQPFDQVDKRRQHGRIANFLDHQHGKRWLIPCQSLASGILNLPINKIFSIQDSRQTCQGILFKVHKSHL